MAAVCVLGRNPPPSLLLALNDSKLLTEKQRDEVYAQITADAGVLWAA